MNNLYQINSGVYKYFAEFLPSINDCVSLQIKTVWPDARNADEMQNKFQIILTKEEMKQLGNQLIEQANK